jgi:hypothetical protein
VLTIAELDAMDANRGGRQVQLARRIYAEVAADHRCPIETVESLHQALRRGWEPTVTHPLVKIAMDLKWHRHRETIL